jgi:hypothetical protein
MDGMIASGARHNRADSDAGVVADLVEKHIEVHRDVIEIDEEKWAIHGRIAYEGEVIAATFASESEAWVGLSCLEKVERDHLV